MRSFILVSGDFTTHGGMDCANYHLARWLADQHDIAVHLVSFNVASPLADHPNVTWHRLAKRFNSYTLSESLLDRAGCAVKKSLPGSMMIVNGGNCSRGDVNWVHYVHAAWVPQTAGNIMLRLRRELQHRKHLRSERRVIAQAGLVIANSHRTRRDLIEHVGIDPAHVRTIYYGTDAASFRPPQAGEREAMRRQLGINLDAPVIAFVGALQDRRKGFDLLFESWRILSKRKWDAKLLVVGRGAQLHALEAQAIAANLGDSIRFLGFRQDVPDLLRACDLLVAPTRYEAYGLGVHEALCCGIPAMVSAGSGVAERYPQSLASMLLPEPIDPQSLADRLYDWRERMSTYAADMSDFSPKLRAISWDDMSRQFLDAIDDAANPSRAAVTTARPDVTRDLSPLGQRSN